MTDCDGKKCFLFDGCPGRTGVCYSCGPDGDECPVYRWFKEKLLKEQKHGHWVLDPDGMDWNIPAWCCSECHCRNDNIPPNMEKVNPLRWSGSKFCPNCGAQMER